MSGVLAVAYPEAAMLITDGAGYDNAGILRTVGPKVTTAKVAAFAVTTRGHAEAGVIFQQALCDCADLMGTAGAVARLGDLVERIRDDIAVDLTGGNAVQVIIASWTVAAGGQCFAFHTGRTDAARPAYEVWELPAFFAFGPSYRPEDAASTPAKRGGETMTAYMRRAGADIMEVMRRRPGNAGEGMDVPDGLFFGVGGRCDLTTVSVAGAKLETLRVWNDRIGCKVDPFATARPAMEIMNRQQRRAINSGVKVRLALK